MLKPFDSLPNNKILHWSKLKAFAEDKINVDEKYNFGFRRVENIVIIFPQCLQKPSVSGLLKVRIVW